MKIRRRMKIGDWLQGACFNLIHKRNLVYNTCWEDPRIDRVALDLGSDDTVLVITSAGCNVLDYALEEPRQIYAIDMNPRQNALLDLKIAGIRNLDFDDFFALFGRGQTENNREIYRTHLRDSLSPWARFYWDRRIDSFSGKGRRPSFYFHGTSGMLAWLINFYIDHIAKVRDHINDLLEARTVDEQQEIYQERLEAAFWTKFLRWMMKKNGTLFLAGVPKEQRHQIEKTYAGGILKFIQDRVETVFTRLPLHDNYFWRVYLSGSYSPDCCPEYLKPENFERLKDGLVDRVQHHTCSILDFLNNHDGEISRYVLLDHMDWLSMKRLPVLYQQWQKMIDCASPQSRFLWRSGALHVDFIDPIEVTLDGRKTKVGDLLTYQSELAEKLHGQDRVHTYGSFYIADLCKP